MKNITIHKKNEIIRGVDDYSLMANRALNAIYWAIQKHKRYEESVRITFTTLRGIMSLEKDNRYIETIQKSLVELQKPMELNNFFHPVYERKFEWFSEPVLLRASSYRLDNNTLIAEVSVSKLVLHIMQQKGNFTPLDLIPIVNTFRTKYAMQLYEYLKSFDDYQYLDITHKHLMKILNLDEKSKYRYMSDLTTLVQRQIKQIVAKSDLKNLKLSQTKELSKNKIFRFVIRKDGLKIATKKHIKKQAEILDTLDFNKIQLF